MSLNSLTQMKSKCLYMQDIFCLRLVPGLIISMDHFNSYTCQQNNSFDMPVVES